MTHRLHSFATPLGLTVVRDAAFANLGFLTSSLRDVVVPLRAPRYLDELVARSDGAIVAVIAHPDVAEAIPSALGLAVATDPIDAFFRLHLLLDEPNRWGGRRGPTQIHPTAVVEPGAHVAASDVTIGAGTRVMAGAIVRERTEIGADCVIHSGAVLGSEGFEVRVIEGRRQVVPHLGGVRVGDRVDIMANTVVCRALFGGATSIGNDTKVDNLVHVAHDVQIGARCKVVASAMLGGSTWIGDDAWIGPNATVSNSLTIGAGAFVSLGAVVTRDVPPGARVSGNFAVDHDKLVRWLRTVR
ncbi:MAG: hypothetical protein H6697_01150 [Myxococcales bacterium]|nr:hypothetical protein [Myxococcales bacterium]MCB9520545.1 hypothetical protein [Myxococcales bacterium]